LKLINIKVLIKTVILTLLLTGGSSFEATILLPHKNGSVEILTILEICFGAGLLGGAVILLRHWDWLRFVPKSGPSRIYFEVVYSILFTWSVMCYSWGEAFRGALFPPPSDLTLQIRDLLTLCAVPPIVGMSADLLIAKWPAKQYQELARAAGLVLIALVIMVVGAYFV
jgi:hypothetical protein